MARQLDDLDRRIAGELQLKADRSNARIAQKLSVSASTVHRRVVELKQAGVITGVVAIVNPRSARRDVLVLVTAKLGSLRDEDLGPFEQWIAGQSDVQSAYLMPEEPAMVLTLRIGHVDELAAKLQALQTDNPVVTETTARVAMRTIKQTLYVPINDLGGRI